MAELIEINLKETLVPGTDVTDEHYLSDEEKWVDAIWIESADIGEVVILLHEPFKGRRTLTLEYRDSIYTILHRVADRARELRDFIERHQDRLQKETTVTTFNTIMVLNQLIYAKKGDHHA